MTPVIHASQLDDAAPVHVVVDDIPVCVVRVADTIFAVYDTCSHQRWSLSDGGMVWGESLECALHGATFNLATGAAETLPATQPIPTFAVSIEDGNVYVDVTTITNGAPFPRH